MDGIIPCLWFDSNAEEAINYYVSTFKDSKIEHVGRYGKEGFEYHQKPEGSVMSITFQVKGQRFMALNGGPLYKFTEAISFQVMCDTQEEIDTYWDRLADGGEEMQCGWVKDKFGVTWQVIPTVLSKLMSDPERAPRVTQAFLSMKKFDIKKLEEA